MKRILLKISLTILVTMVNIPTTRSQEFDIGKYRLFYQFSTIKQADNSRILSVNFIARNKKNRKDRIPIYQGEITFVNVLGDKEVVLGRTKTNKEGKTDLTIPKNHKYLVDSDGFVNLEARFKKTDLLNKKIAKLQFKEVFLDLALRTKDSLNTVVLKAFTLDSLGTKLPVDNLPVTIAVKGMLSNMILEEATVLEGTYLLEFPDDIPGDINGNITVYTTIEDHDEFGDVIQEATAVWGTARVQQKESNHMLWSSAAPYWMYVVLTILLVGVWANYVYTIYNLFKLKKEGQFLEYN